MKKSIHLILLLANVMLYAQVGINTQNPTALLDVNGNVKLEGNLYLENPGDFTIIRGSKLLINSTDNKILQYDIEESRYGPINYVQFAFKNTNTNGLDDYDTQIATEDYLVTVQGYYFSGPNENTNIMPHSSISDDDIPGFQMYAYPNADTGTWFVRGKFNDANFRASTNGGFTDVQVDLYMNLIIYRNGFISKAQNQITVDMNDAETNIAPLPAGF